MDGLGFREPLDQLALGVNQVMHPIPTSVPLTMEGAHRDAKTLMIPTSATAMKDMRLLIGITAVQVTTCFVTQINIYHKLRFLMDNKSISKLYAV